MNLHLPSYILGIVFVLFVSFTLSFYEKRDKELEISAKAYELCIEEEFGGRSVQEVYENLHYYPECK